MEEHSFTQDNVNMIQSIQLDDSCVIQLCCTPLIRTSVDTLDYCYIYLHDLTHHALVGSYSICSLKPTSPSEQRKFNYICLKFDHKYEEPLRKYFNTNSIEELTHTVCKKACERVYLQNK